MALIAYFLWLLAFGVSVGAAWWFPAQTMLARLLPIIVTGAAGTGLLTWFVTRRRSDSTDLDDVIASIPSPTPPTTPYTTSGLESIESAPWEEYFAVVLRDRPFRETAEKLAELFPRLFPHCSGALYLHNSGNQTLQMILAFGERVVGPNNFNPNECESFFHADIQVREEGIPGGHPFCSHIRHADTGLSLCAPIEGLGEHLGVLCLQHPAGALDEFFLLPFKRRLRLVTSTLGLALANLNLQAKFQLHSIRDPLTGMFNRRYLEESLQREVAAAERRRVSIGMILIYPDSVRSYRTDHESHAADQLLWELGQRLPRYIRTEDIPCRYDGDVLCVLLPGADPGIVQERAERIRQEVEGLEVRFNDLLLHTTLSLGVATLPRCGNTSRALSVACEKALYQAQTSGGNKAVFAG